MNNQKHYGTLIHWFDNMQCGSITADDLEESLVVAEIHNLSPSYSCPQPGDRVRFSIEHRQGQLFACNIERQTPENEQSLHNKLTPIPDQPRQSATIILTEWDWAQNSGFGMNQNHPDQPVFLLGQFLVDQSRVPEAGDHIQGTLLQHDNGHWMLMDAVITLSARAKPSTSRTRDIPPKEISLPAASPTQGDAPRAKTAPSAADTIPPPPVSITPPPTTPVETVYKAPRNIDFIPPNQVMSGNIVNWDNEKGYGFICFGDAHQNIFFHATAFHYAAKRPQVGQSVSFYCKPSIPQEKRQKAERVVLKGDEAFLFTTLTPDHNNLNINMPKLILNSLIGCVFLAAVSYHSSILAAVYLAFSLVAFILYRSDKRTAQKRTKTHSGYLGRVPEKNLHLLALLGGWPGALIARAAFNHKTSKAEFIRAFWLTVVINIAITYVLLIHYADNPLLSLLKN